MQIKNWISRLQALAGVPACRRDLPFWTVVGLAILAVSIVFNRFGVLHFELWNFIPYHLGPGPVWEKIFDNRTLDYGIYEGRELSYLIDHFDVLMVALSVKWGCPMFISATHVFLCVFIGVWIGWFAAKDLGLGSLIGLLLALLFWTAPFVYLHYLLRSGKVLAAAALVVLIAEIHRAWVRKVDEKGGWLCFRFASSIVASAWVLSFSDRQGFFFLVGACLLMAFQWMKNKDRLAGRILLWLTAVLVLELVYFFWIAPALTKAFFGYASDFSFNRLPAGDLLAKPIYFAGQALALLADTCSFTLGRIPHWAVALILGAALGASLVRDIRLRSWREWIPLTGVIAASLVALWVMNALMILRHPPLLWPDVRLVYYWIPTGALIVLGAACAMGGWAGQNPWRKTALASVLLVLVFRNVAALPDHWRVFAAGHLGDYIKINPDIRGALMHREDPGYIVSPEVEKIPAYKALLKYAPKPANLAARRREFGSWLFYRHTRSSGAPVPFERRFGGNVDARFLSSSAGFFESEAGRGFLGATEGRLQMRVNLSANRLHGEVIMRRTGSDVAQPLAADFAIYAQQDAATRYERWSARVELPGGQREVVVPYAVDSSHLPTTFTLDIPAIYAGKMAAGWRNPSITDVGGDSTAPVWFNRSNSPVVVLDEAALAKLLPADWRPVQAQMRDGRVTEAGIELSPSGEIWIQARDTVSKFTGVATAIPEAGPAHRPWVSGFWYKAGRLDTYASPTPETDTDQLVAFQAWCGEPGGWLVIAVEPDPVMSPVLVRVTAVVQNH